MAAHKNRGERRRMKAPTSATTSCIAMARTKTENRRTAGSTPTIQGPTLRNTTGRQSLARHNRNADLRHNEQPIGLADSSGAGLLYRTGEVLQ
ncbi:hypothetical protein D3C76_995290 [compost metagenome]